MVEVIEGRRGDAAGRSQRWAWFGVAVAAVGVVATVMPSAGFSVADDIPVAEMVSKLEDAKGSLLLGGGIQALASMGLIVFGAWLHRVLRDREPDDSLAPTIAFGGSLVTAAMMAMAAAHTQLSGAMEDGVQAPILLTIHTLEENLFAGAWCTMAVVAATVAVSALRRGTLPRWLGGVSAFVAVLLLVAQLVVPWAGWFPAVVWVAVCSVGLRSAER